MINKGGNITLRIQYRKSGDIFGNYSFIQYRFKTPQDLQKAFQNLEQIGTYKNNYSARKLMMLSFYDQDKSSIAGQENFRDFFISVGECEVSDYLNYLSERKIKNENKKNSVLLQLKSFKQGKQPSIFEKEFFLDESDIAPLKEKVEQISEKQQERKQQRQQKGQKRGDKWQDF